MVWWIGFWAVAGALYVLVLDYRGRMQTGRPWLSEGWAARLPFYALFGGASGALLADIPIFLFDLGRHIVGLVTNPPTPCMLLPLLPVLVGAAAGFALIKVALQRWQTGIRGRQTATLPRGIGGLSLAAGLFMLAMLSLWLGAFLSINVLSDS